MLLDIVFFCWCASGIRTNVREGDDFWTLWNILFSALWLTLAVVDIAHGKWWY